MTDVAATETQTQHNVPQHCPGTQSESAGKASACQGCPNQPTCSTNTAQQGDDPDICLIDENLDQVQFKLIILSGKGGVGKSTFTSQLSFWLSQDEGKQIGVLDLDVCGPSMPTMMGCSSETLHVSRSGWSPIYKKDNLSVMSVGFLLAQDNLAVIWRGPKKNGLIKQFLKDVDWGALDVLLIDTPPGTSDEHLSIVQYLKHHKCAAIIITTPQEVSLQDVRKEIDFCRKVKLPIIGVVENMGLFECPHCRQSSAIFAPSSGGAKKMADDLNVHFLGALPLDPLIGGRVRHPVDSLLFLHLGRSSDKGLSFFDASNASPLLYQRSFANIAQKVMDYIDSQSAI